MGTMEIVAVVLVFIAGSSGLALGVIQARTGRPLMRLRWDGAIWACWLLIFFGGTLVILALALAIRGEDSAVALVIVGVPVGLLGGVLLALRRRTMKPTPITPRDDIAANFLFVGFGLLLTMLTAVIEQGRSLWLLLVPFVFFGLGLYVLRRQRG